MLVLSGVAWGQDYQERKAEADRLLQSGSYNQAAEKFADLAAAYADKIQPLNGLGFALFHGGDFEGAVAAFEKAMKIQPKNESTLKNLILASGRRATEMPPAKGLEELEKLKRRFPGHPQLPAIDYYIGHIYFLTGDVDRGKKIWKAVAEARPSSNTGVFLRGLEAFSNGKAEEAIPDLQSALQRSPESPIYKLYLGRAQLAAGRRDDSVTTFESLVNSTSRPELLQKAATMLVLANDKVRAEGALVKASSMGSPPALLQLGAFKNDRAMVERAFQGKKESVLYLQTGSSLVYLDSDVVGLAPAARFVGQGVHRLRLVTPSGKVFTREFQVQPDQLLLVSFSEELKIDTRPRHAGLIPGL